MKRSHGRAALAAVAISGLALVGSAVYPFTGPSLTSDDVEPLLPSITGTVVEVSGTSIVVETDDGDRRTFDSSESGVSQAHLREHLTTGDQVVIYWTESKDGAVAERILDA
jgi:hypothetical protein